MGTSITISHARAMGTPHFERPLQRKRYRGISVLGRDRLGCAKWEGEGREASTGEKPPPLGQGTPGTPVLYLVLGLLTSLRGLKCSPLPVLAQEALAALVQEFASLSKSQSQQ